MAQRMIVEEKQTMCLGCGGTGQERSYNSTAVWVTCQRCHGSGFIVTERTVRYEPVEEVADADRR